MPKSEVRRTVEKRILDAEKVVVSNILNNWRKKYGMDYAIVVLNTDASSVRGEERVFSRIRVSETHLELFKEKIKELWWMSSSKE